MTSPSALAAVAPLNGPLNAPPEAPADARDRILAAIAAIGPRLEASNAESESLRHLAPDAAAALKEAGLINLKIPRELGGDEADWTLQTEAFEAVAYHSFSAAWCLMLYADNTGRPFAALPEAGIARLRADGDTPVICGGGGMMMGVLTPAPGGYRLSGRWVYGSGIAQSDYALVTARRADDEGPRPTIIQCVVPTAEIDVEDNWKVMGLKGTGSADYAVNDVFVPEELTFAQTAPPLRGGALYRLSTFGYAGLCMPAVMNGAARRALDDLARRAASKARGYVKKTTLADRGVFQAFLGEADLKLKAARQLSIAMGEKLLRDAAIHGKSPEANEAEARAVGSYCSKVAIEVMNGVIAYAGGEGVRTGHSFERTLRDMHMAGTHMFVSDIAFENHAQFLMDLPGVGVSA